MKKFIRVKVLIFTISIFLTVHVQAGEKIIPLPKPAVDNELKKKVAKKKEIYPQKKPAKEKVQKTDRINVINGRKT